MTEPIIDPKTLKPGTRVSWRGQSVMVLARRKDDDTGWWLEDNPGGLADKVLTGEWDSERAFRVLDDGGEGDDA